MFGREFGVLLICVFFLWSHVLADKPDCVRDDNGRNVSLVTGQCDEVKTSFIVKSKERELAFTITYSGYSIQGRQFILQMGTCKIEARIFKGGQNAAFLVLVDRSGQGPYYNLPIEGKVDENKLFFEGRYYGIDKKIWCEPFTGDKSANLVPVDYVAEKKIYNFNVLFHNAEYYELTGWEFTGWKTISVALTVLIVCVFGSVLIPGVFYYLKKSKEKKDVKEPTGKSMNTKKEAIPEVSKISKKKTAKHVTEFKKTDREEETTKSSPMNSQFLSKK